MKKSEDILTKKGLKNFINENGFFSKMELCEATPPNGMEVPEGAKFFKGIASTGELNRNGYKIQEEAWKDSIETFMTNPVILLQHDSKSPIGKATSASVTEKGLEVEGFVFQNLMDETSWKAFENGVLKGLSTGHITKHAKFENTETGEIVDEDDIGSKGNPNWFDIIFDNVWTMIVTSLDWVEFSLVTIPANSKSMILEKNTTDKKDAVSKYALNSGKISQEDLEKMESHVIEEEESSEEETKESPEGEEPKKDPEQPEVESSEGKETDENSGGNPEGGEEAPENGDEPVAEVEEEPEEAPENGDKPDEKTSEEPEKEQPEEEGEQEENELLEKTLKDMTSNLAKNLLSLEKEFSESRQGAMKSEDVNALIEKKLNNVVSEQNLIIQKLAETVVALSNSVKSSNERLDKIAVNKPFIVHQQLEKAKAKKKNSWA